MTTSQYNKLTAPVRAKETLLKTIIIINKTLTYLCYFLYPLLIVLLAVKQCRALMLRCILVAGISFILVSIFRKLINCKRPYEALDIEPLIYKSTKGKSFPSRHVFCVFIIAMCWLNFMPVVGIFLFVVGIIMAAVRVLGGVHFPRDVIAGAVIGIIAGIIGFYVV